MRTKHHKKITEDRLWKIFEIDPNRAIRFCKRKGLKGLCQKMQQRL